MFCGPNRHMIRGHTEFKGRRDSPKPERGTGLVWNGELPLQRERFGKCCWLYLTPRCAHYFFASLVHLFFFSSYIPVFWGIEPGGGGITMCSTSTDTLRWKAVN